VTSAEKYITGAYLVVLAVVLVYVVLYSFKLARLERAVAELPRTRSERSATEHGCRCRCSLRRERELGAARG
jgi:type II secretory pathway component PulM